VRRGGERCRGCEFSWSIPPRRFVLQPTVVAHASRQPLAEGWNPFGIQRTKGVGNGAIFASSLRLRPS
jgi:hypothetical protein